jgi:hypothetical protein
MFQSAEEIEVGREVNQLRQAGSISWLAEVLFWRVEVGAWGGGQIWVA